MRKLLLLALLLCKFKLTVNIDTEQDNDRIEYIPDNIVALATRSSNNYDYEDIDGNKKLIDERRNWRKKALLKTEHHKDWDSKRHEFDNRYLDESDTKTFSGMERPKELDMSAAYRAPHHFDDVKSNMPFGMKSSEVPHSSNFLEKEVEKKSSIIMNCERPHERYEACFAGCASVSCDNPRDRLRPCYPFCEPGCICIHPYVRDDRTHKCILPEDCTKGLKGIPDLAEDI